jgi:hypothetical protein
MKMRASLFCVLVAALFSAPVAARPGPGWQRWQRENAELPPPPPPPMQRRSDQDYARDAMRAGAIRPLREIQREWRIDMPGYDFIGSEYDPDGGSYRLKFMRGGDVVWVDVDGRGREIRRSGR